jgi:hypothetical protein
VLITAQHILDLVGTGIAGRVRMIEAELAHHGDLPFVMAGVEESTNGLEQRDETRNGDVWMSIAASLVSQW